jgi:hypothetical protein
MWVQGSHSGCVPPLAGVKCNNGYSTLLTDLQDGIYRMGLTGSELDRSQLDLSGFTGGSQIHRHITHE